MAEAPDDEPEAPDPFVAGGACASDGDCRFDDGCVPEACGTGSALDAVECEESAPAPGTCVCFEGSCALRRHEEDAMTSDAACERSGEAACTLDRARGVCAPGAGETKGGTVGPHCYCDSREPRRCHLRWLEPVPCRSARDCWIEVLPFRHPVPRPRRFRRREFRPCEDGEVAPACDDGVCALGAHYTC